MALVAYPDLPQCEGTTRNEVTAILSDLSENGVPRGRSMNESPTYELTVVHNLSKADYDVFDAWWKANFNNEISITWVVDGITYRGFARRSPGLEYSDYRYNVSLLLLVKESG